MAARFCTLPLAPLLAPLAPSCVRPAPCRCPRRLCLQAFAQGLLHSGYRDKAASVYYSLLLSVNDRAQQAELLRCCLACWSQPAASSGGGGAGVPALLAAEAHAPAALTNGCGGGGGAADGHMVEQLIRLFSRQSALTWGQVSRVWHPPGKCCARKHMSHCVCSAYLFSSYVQPPRAILCHVLSAAGSGVSWLSSLLHRLWTWRQRRGWGSALLPGGQCSFPPRLRRGRTTVAGA